MQTRFLVAKICKIWWPITWWVKKTFSGKIWECHSELLPDPVTLIHCALYKHNQFVFRGALLWARCGNYQYNQFVFRGALLWARCGNYQYNQFVFRGALLWAWCGNYQYNQFVFRGALLWTRCGNCHVIWWLAFLNAWDACCIELSLMLPGTERYCFVQH